MCQRIPTEMKWVEESIGAVSSICAFVFVNESLVSVFVTFGVFSFASLSTSSTSTASSLMAPASQGKFSDFSTLPLRGVQGMSMHC